MVRNLIIFIVFVCILSGCRIKTIYVPVERRTIETVTLIDTIVEIKIEHIRDTVAIPDTISFLSNKYTFSWAEWKDGLLRHSLSTWPDAFQ